MGNKRSRARRGVSLIEVLVVLVLLVLGILIIVRLYPSGFFSITSVGNAALADGLGQAAVQAQSQDAVGLPDAILPGPLDLNGSGMTAAQISQLSNYDPEYNTVAQPDYSATLNNARVVSNETITVPAAASIVTASGVSRESIYVVNYGPIVLPLDPVANTAQFNSNLMINSPPWAAVAGTVPAAGDADPDLPQHTLSPRQERFLVDLTNQRVAVPYAAYTNVPAQNKTTVGTSVANSYAQKMVVMIFASDGKTYTQYLNVPPATPRDDTNPYAPETTAADNSHFLPDSTANYQGGWMDPTKQYPDNSFPAPQTLLPAGVSWKAVVLYRSYQGLLTTTPPAFGPDPYQFMLLNSNIGGVNPGANVGAIAFNPLAAGGSGSAALKAQISYQTYSWKILREDRDIPALPDGNTAVERLTLKNLKRAGDANPDDTIYSGLVPNSNHGLIILDLNTGLAVGKDPNNIDPTIGEFNDEDLNGPSPNAVYLTKVIDVSYATGRLTFPADLGDGVNKAHRVRVFYAGDADWTVAVQKAPSYYSLNPTDVTGGSDPLLGPTQYAFDPNQRLVYFPRSDAGKSVELTGTYTTGSGTLTLHSFAETAAISPGVLTLGTGSYVAVNLSDTQLASPLPGNAGNIIVTAVRGLSVRAVVAWKERDRWKVHSVDTVLNRAQ